MATIREKLVLDDHFSRTFGKYYSSVNRAAGVTGGLTRKIIAVGSAILSVQGLVKAASFSDTVATTAARIDAMNDGLQTTAELTQMIYDSANRSRGAYQDTADMVAKLGTLAGEAFGSNAEIVAFAEQINKQMTLSGATTAGRQAAMLQLTQAMSSGVLRGEELNSILEQAPTIAKTIARYLGVSTGEMRELAASGKVTASIVKNAIFTYAAETNAQFEQMPMTFSQAATRIKNAAQKNFTPIAERLSELLNSDVGRAAVNGAIRLIERLGRAADWALDKITDGARWAGDNWDKLIPIFAGVAGAAAAAGAVSAAAGLSAAAGWLAAYWPLLLVAAGIAGVIALARKFGATWSDICGVVGGYFGMVYSYAMNEFIVPFQRAIAMLVNFIGNAFRGVAESVPMFFTELALSVLERVYEIARGIEEMLNLLPDASVDLTSGIAQMIDEVRGGSTEALKASGVWKEYVKPWEYESYTDNVKAALGKGNQVGSAIDSFDPNALIADLAGEMQTVTEELAGIAADVAGISDAVSMSDETLRSLVDVAQRQYVNQINLTAQTPVVNVSGANTGSSEADRRALANAIRDVLIEQSAAGSYISTANT